MSEEKARFNVVALDAPDVVPDELELEDEHAVAKSASASPSASRSRGVFTRSAFREGSLNHSRWLFRRCFETENGTRNDLTRV